MLQSHLSYKVGMKRIAILGVAIFSLSTVSGLDNSITYAANPFAGSLNSISIVDSSGTNAPPVASMSHTITNNVISLDASGSTDSDGTITEYKWQVSNGATLSGAKVTVTVTDTDYPVTVTLSEIDNLGGVTLLQKTISKQTIAPKAFNFQPAAAAIPAGYVADSGTAFNLTKGYGWKVASIKDMFDRNNPESPDQTYDTLINVYPDAVWEVVVPNGSYKVKVLVGDPTYPAAYNSVQIESLDLMVKEQTSNTGVKWVEKEGVFQVNDGRLTMTFLTSSPIAKICRISIQSM